MEETVNTSESTPKKMSFDMSSEFNASLQRQYIRARDKLFAQTMSVQKRKKAYHKAMFNVEKKAIKAELAMSPEIVANTKKELKDLTKKALSLKDKYKSQIIDWRSKFAVILELTGQIAQACAKTEPVCLNYSLSTMKPGAASVTGGASDAEADTNPKSTTRIDKVQVLKEKICSPVFEEYIPAGKKNEMFKAALTAEITGMPDGDDPDNFDKKSENIDKNDAKDMEKEAESEQLFPLKWKAHISAVIKDYTKQTFDQLSLHVGEEVIQVLPPDNSGMAYGAKRGRLFRKEKGFFPVTHVQDSGLTMGNNVFSNKKKRNRNPVLRLLNGITETKTKLSFLEQVATEDGAKVYDVKKPKKVICKRNWLKTIYGIDISDDEIYTPMKTFEDDHFDIPVAVPIPPEDGAFFKKPDAAKIASKNTKTTQKDLVLEDMEYNDKQKDNLYNDMVEMTEVTSLN